MTSYASKKSVAMGGLYTSSSTMTPPFIINGCLTPYVKNEEEVLKK